MIANDFFSDERGDITVFVPSAERIGPIGRVEPLSVPPVELATIVHSGSHTDIDRADGARATDVSDGALGVDGPIRERYLVGRLDTDDETVWRTADWLAHLPHRSGRLSGRRTEAIHARRESPATQPATMSATSASLLRNE